jgi:hypothetical protein
MFGDDVLLYPRLEPYATAFAASSILHTEEIISSDPVNKLQGGLGTIEERGRHPADQPRTPSPWRLLPA